MKYGSDNVYDNSLVKSKITEIAAAAFTENEKLGIIPNEGNEVIWAPARSIINSYFVSNSTTEENFS